MNLPPLPKIEMQALQFETHSFRRASDTQPYESLVERVRANAGEMERGYDVELFAKDVQATLICSMWVLF